MWKSLMLGAVLSIGALPVTADAGNAVTWTGWFSDKQCARVTDGNVKPNGTECVKKCLDEGATPVFLSEQAKAIFDVTDATSLAKENVGWYLQVTGVVDETNKTIAVQSIKRISQVQNTCAIPKKKS